MQKLPEGAGSSQRCACVRALRATKAGGERGLRCTLSLTGSTSSGVSASAARTTVTAAVSKMYIWKPEEGSHGQLAGGQAKGERRETDRADAERSELVGHERQSQGAGAGQPGQEGVDRNRAGEER